jgi:peptide/nickel transport system substrate-binding protein
MRRSTPSLPMAPIWSFRSRSRSGGVPAFLAEYRSQILAPLAFGADGMATSVIATGPFKVTELQAPMSLKTERNEAYWGDKPAIAKASYSAIGRAETRALMVESGGADFVFLKGNM